MRSLLLLWLLLFSLCALSQKQPDTTLIALLKANEAASVQIQSLTRQVAELKGQIQTQQRIGNDKFLSASFFLDAAIGGVNCVQALVIKEGYRNKIASLNNPASSELGFNLEIEIRNALKPLLAKAKKTNTNKFGEAVASLLNTGRSGVSLFPAANVFTSIVGMAGNLMIQEKGIDQKDFEDFISSLKNTSTNMKGCIKPIYGLTTTLKSSETD